MAAQNYDRKWRLSRWLVIASFVCVIMSGSPWAMTGWLLMAWVNIITMQVSVHKRHLPAEWREV